MTQQLFHAHRALLRDANEAVSTRSYFSPFEESPSAAKHPEGAKTSGEAAFRNGLGNPHPVSLPYEVGRVSNEVSPYTLQELGVTYPRCDVNAVCGAAQTAQASWASVDPEARVGVCLEILHRLSKQVFENAFATMHTSGQAFMMAFAGSGANSLDRGLEGIVYAHKAMAEIPKSATYVRSFGRATDVCIEKRYRLVPRGVAAVITCGSYPAWNAYPALFANLATGNPVVVKPHPRAILTMANLVHLARTTLEEFGYDADAVSMLCDSPDEPVTKELVMHESIAIVDFTGSQEFGAWLETNLVGKLVYTETAGCNAVVVDSTSDLDATLYSIAHGVSLFSSQMCTAPQNIFISKHGIKTPEGLVSAEEFEQKLVDTVDVLVSKHAGAVCGALFDERTKARVEALAKSEDVIRFPEPYVHEAFPDARTITPLICRVSASDEVYRREQFGPIAFVIRCEDRAQILERVVEDVRTCGAIATYAYSTDEPFVEELIAVLGPVGANVGINLHRHLPINFTAAYSDFHVTGLNPAGNACLTDLAFVTQRFRVVQSKIERA